MIRIDRPRRDAARFPMVLTVPTRSDDLDVQGHVNNVAAVAILHEGRVRFNLDVGLGGHLSALPVLVGSIAVDYAGELHHPDPVEIGTGVFAIGRTSITVGQRVTRGGAPRPCAQTVLVLADADGPTPIPDAVRESYGARMT